MYIFQELNLSIEFVYGTVIKLFCRSLVIFFKYITGCEEGETEGPFLDIIYVTYCAMHID